ncbi:hypothetical protein AXW67_10740 [Bradyrhizobium neotropicale]|uniref:Uncharacterized protein n=1 Tax=Bradyrhizobium neotropicale TaxID=1497615 RepID=A0A176ZBT5_9BRAD|nr:hypothetical protein AXW67_10740 [Bradyrhizobium neotropicale]
MPLFSVIREVGKQSAAAPVRGGRALAVGRGKAAMKVFVAEWLEMVVIFDKPTVVGRKTIFLHINRTISYESKVNLHAPQCRTRM